MKNCYKNRRIISKILQPLKKRRESEESELLLIESENLDLKLESLESTSVVPTIRLWKSNREQQMCAKHQHSGRLPP